MDQRHNNGAAGGANSNVNNNVNGKRNPKKPDVPSKPRHLQGVKAAQVAMPTNVVTPRGWAPQQKFSFNDVGQKSGVTDEKSNIHSDSPFVQKWRPAPKIMEKKLSVKKSIDHQSDISEDKVGNDSNSKYPSVKKEEEQNLPEVEHSPSSQLPAESFSKDENEQKEFGSLKRMWSHKVKVTSESPLQSPRTRPRSKTNEARPKPSQAPNMEYSIPSPESEKQSLSRSTSSSSNGSVRTASFKDRKVVWHYVTTQSSSSEFIADSLPSQIDLNESVLQETTEGRKFNQSILAPRPFRASAIVDSGNMLPKSSGVVSDDPEVKQEKNGVENRSDPDGSPALSEDSGSSSGEAEDEKEMENARKRGVLVTRFDSHGNMYKIDPRTGQIWSIEDTRKLDEEQDNSRSHAALRRMDAVSLEGITVSESSTDRQSEEEEIPPPLLPREKNPHQVGVPGVSRPGSYFQNSLTPGSMYPARNRNQNYISSRNPVQQSNMSPDSAVPPPLLPRRQLPDEEPPQDYTPMAGSISESLSRNRNDSRASSASLNSTLDKAYEPMEPKSEEDDPFCYSAAIDPPKRTSSVREYHEIDADPEVPISAGDLPLVDPVSVPPPPPHKPPALPQGVKSQSGSTTESPPPLPPMNTKRLHYIKVDIGTKNPDAANDIRAKSQKTNYTEVVVGGGVNHPKGDSDPKKGKSVKGKLFSMFSSKQDGYSSEGDAIAGSKTDDERTTDFSKERNKLKRISGRLLRKKKQKSKDESRHSMEAEMSSQSDIHGNTAVGIYGSATNLSTTSSESSRSLTQAASSGSSGDGQARSHYPAQGTYPKSANSGRRRSEETARSLAPKLEEKSRSVLDLDSAHTSLSKPPEKNESYQAQKSGSDAGSSPMVTAPRVHSHLHTQSAVRQTARPTSPRPTSEPPGVQVDSSVQVKGPRPKSSPYDLDVESKSPRMSGRQDNTVLPLHIVKDSNIGTEEKLLSPNFPTDAPPPPPGLESLPSRPSPPTGSPPNRPPAPMRELKPDRFKKRVQSGSSETDYTAAEEIHKVDFDCNNSGDPIYDDVSPNLPVPPLHGALSASARSKLLDSEPLYQVYRSRTLSHASMKGRRDPAEKRRVKTTSSVENKNNPEERWQSDLMTDDAGATTLWREVKEVVESGIGGDMSNSEMKLQQAQFEVVTSQASYMRSLNILIDHFMRDPTMEDPEILPKKQRKELFSNIIAVREIEQRFLQEIEQHFWNKLYLTDIANLAAKYAKSDFEVYVRYVQNQVYQDRVLTELQRTNEKFAAELGRLESSPSCNKLPLLSFLLLPMQRVTRLPLLISAIVNKADSASDKKAYDSAKQALVVVNKLVKKCNEGARKMQQTEQLAEIAKDLVFAPKVKTYALVSQSRSVVKKGEMSVIMMLENRKTKAMKLWFFLFSDVLLLAKKKNFLEAGVGPKYEVIDWAKRAMLFVNERAVAENEIFLVLLENCVGKRVELTLTPVSLNELSRWTDALNPQHSNDSGDSIYESWDCPQYHCIVPYTAVQPDELSLDVGDVMRVLKKTGDGWLEGERLRDNEQGWFPAENCEEIEDGHVRARNLKNLYRIQPAGGSAQD